MRTKCLIPSLDEKPQLRTPAHESTFLANEWIRPKPWRDIFIRSNDEALTKPELFAC